MSIIIIIIIYIQCRSLGMRLNNDSYNYRLPKLTLKRFNHTRQYSILINKLAAAKQLA